MSSCWWLGCQRMFSYSFHSNACIEKDHANFLTVQAIAALNKKAEEEKEEEKEKEKENGADNSGDVDLEVEI